MSLLKVRTELQSENGEKGPAVRAAMTTTPAAGSGASGSRRSDEPSTVPTSSGGDKKEISQGLRPVVGPLETIGFELETVSPSLVSGRMKITDAVTQIFKVLHGGVSALVAEGLASIGAHVASGYRRVAGVQLSINHHRPAMLGDVITAESTPVHVGKTVQVWEVKLWRLNPATSEKLHLIASSNVTLLANLPVPKHAADATEALRKRAML